MDAIYIKIRNHAREIASRFPKQIFYSVFFKEIEKSKIFFQTDPFILKLYDFVADNIGKNFGHGLEHATKVTIDAGALVLIEGKRAGYARDYMERRLLLAQCAGLLHDMKREYKSHAEKGAWFAREVLIKAGCFEGDEVDDVSNAIYNHEAFRETIDLKTAEGTLLSDSLYDADKFRWGPDNFKHMVWDMVAISNTPPSKFITLYPKGIKNLGKIKTTFRTKTGKQYGPMFIETGIAIGEELYKVIKSDF